MINVLVVDDSAVVRTYIKNILERDKEIKVIGFAKDGEEAIRLAEKMMPNVITMDINMPNMNGFEATRRIMETRPVPIVIVTASYNKSDVEKSFHSLDAGAVAILEKPFGEGHSECEKIENELVQTVKLMSEVKVIRRWKKESYQYREKAKTALHHKRIRRIKVIAMGASTGGPPVLQLILSRLKEGYPAPILVVQHISKGFLNGFVDWIRQATSLPVHIAVDGEHLLPGHIYFAQDDYHLGVDSEERIRMSKAKLENGIRPSVSYLFRSILNTFDGEAVGVLLTGMGKDGAMELKMMKENGAVTIAQDEESSVVYGMPGEAVRLNGATFVLSPEEIASTLENLAGRE